MAINYGIKHEWTDSEELMADFMIHYTVSCF